MSKNRNLGNTVKNDGVITLPSGTTAQRPENAQVGTLRYNTDIGLIEQYNNVGWQAVDAPPVVINYSGIINADTNSTITVNGANFKSGCVIYIEGAAVSNVPRALTTTLVNSTQLTADTAASSTNYVGGASFNIKVVNPSGLSASLISVGSIDRDPIWSTNAGNIATINDEYGSYSPIATLSASDPDGTSIAYSVTSGSLPTNVTLNSSNGQISGNPANVSGATTYTFDVTASSNTQSVARTFNIIVNPTADGSSSTRAATNAQNLYNLGIRTNGYYYLNLGSSTQQIYCILDESIESGYGYMRVWDQRTASTSTEISHFYNETDYAAFSSAGGLSFVISHFATARYDNQSAIVKYTNNGGGLYSGFSPKTISSALAGSWVATGFETDNWRYFGSGTTTGTSPSTSQLFLLDDNDAGGAVSSRQTQKTKTPQGVLIFPSTTANSWGDAGNQYYGQGGMGGCVVAFYVR